MLFIKKKKIITLLYACILSMVFSQLAAYARTDEIQPRASEYIRSTSVTMTPMGDGVLLLQNKLGATGVVDKLGIISLEVQTKTHGYWDSIYTIVTDDYLYDTGTYIYDCYYDGTAGTEYRSYVEFYVEKDGGSEIKIVTSSPQTAE